MSDDFKGRGGSPWGSPPGGGSGNGNGSGRGPTPPDIDAIIREFQDKIKRFLPGGKSSSGRSAGLILLILIFIILFIFVQWLRQDLNPIIIDLILIRVKAYFFGYLSAFTLWFSDSGSLISITSYLSTFAGPMNLIGIIERDLGFYETISINNYTSTNIYTAFRGLITDFSIVGSFLFNFCIIFQIFNNF